MHYVYLKNHSQIIFFVDVKKLSRTIVQLSQCYHCSILDLYNTPIIQIYNLVETINEGSV